MLFRGGPPDDTPFNSSFSLVMLFVSVSSVFIISALSSDFMALFFSNFEINICSILKVTFLCLNLNNAYKIFLKIFQMHFILLYIMLNCSRVLSSRIHHLEQNFVRHLLLSLSAKDNLIYRILVWTAILHQTIKLTDLALWGQIKQSIKAFLL